MRQQDFSRYGLLLVFLILLYFSYLTIERFITYLLFSVILVIVFYPLYTKLVSRTNKPKLVSISFVLALILLIVIPTVAVGTFVIQQAPGAYASVVDAVDVSAIESVINQYIGVDVDIDSTLDASVRNFSNYVFDNITQVASQAIDVILGLFIMFFAMYYIFTDAKYLKENLRAVSPLNKKQHEQLQKELAKTIQGIMNGMLIIGVIQATLSAATYLALQVPNALLWSLLTFVVSVIPVIGAFIVWVPIAIWLFISGSIVQAIILVIIGGAILSQVDNVIRPFIVGKTATIHPALVIIGVFGGMTAFGLIGFVVGPLVLALLVTVINFYKDLPTST